MAIPSSAVNRWMTRYGLRPRPAANTLAVIVCSNTGFRVEKPLAQCNKTYFGAKKPSLSLWLTIRLSLSFAYLVTLIYIKFSSGLAANLWPGWIDQLIQSSLSRRTYHFVTTNVKFDELWEHQTSNFYRKTNIFSLISDWTKPLRGNVAPDLFIMRKHWIYLLPRTIFILWFF